MDDKEYICFSAKMGGRFTRIEIGPHVPLDELCESFKLFTIAVGYVVDCRSEIEFIAPTKDEDVGHEL